MGNINEYLNMQINSGGGYEKPLVSVITPSFNSEKYIKYTIESVLNQSLPAFEMLIVDDCSTDKTCEIVEQYMQKDKRVKLIKLQKNSGAAIARNTALEHSQGRFIAYIDSDDLWRKDKLEKQVGFMLSTDVAFSCTSYEVIDDTGRPLNKIIHMLISVDYKTFLCNNLLQTVGIMVDTEKVDKSYLKMPLLRRRQDAATWLQVLKAGYPCYGLDLILASYRRANSSLSSNKIKAVKGVWYLYRKVENLSLPFSCYCFVRYATLAVWKRLYTNKGT